MEPAIPVYPSEVRCRRSSAHELSICEDIPIPLTLKRKFLHDGGPTFERMVGISTMEVSRRDRCAERLVLSGVLTSHLYSLGPTTRGTEQLQATP